MSQDASQNSLMPSVLDRLIDPDSLGTPANPWYGVEQLSNAVRRDLLALLNSRQTNQGLCDEYPECNRSLLAFGLPDLPSLEAYTVVQREAIGRHIESVICLFEPRLSDVRVTLSSPMDVRERAVHYMVEATLHIDSAPDVAFEVILELTTGQYDIETRRA
jgi:type VI secretion system protein ImpF